MSTKAKTIYKPLVSTRHCQKFFEASVPAGFPSPAADYKQSSLNLNEYLIRHPAATFFVKASGESMTGAGIHSNDILVIDRSIEPKDKSIVIAAIDGELTVKRLSIRSSRITLVPENPDYQPQQVSQDAEFEIWGVVTYVIHQL